MAVILNQDNFEDTINSGKLVLVDFWAEWCMPCKIMNPVIEEIDNDIDSEKVVVGKCDVQNEQAIASKFGIMSIPSFLIFKNGKVMEQFIGVVKKEQLVEKINQYQD